MVRVEENLWIWDIHLVRKIYDIWTEKKGGAWFAKKTRISITLKDEHIYNIANGRPPHGFSI